MDWNRMQSFYCTWHEFWHGLWQHSVCKFMTPCRTLTNECYSVGKSSGTREEVCHTQRNETRRKRVRRALAAYRVNASVGKPFSRLKIEFRTTLNFCRRPVLYCIWHTVRPSPSVLVLEVHLKSLTINTSTIFYIIWSRKRGCRELIRDRIASGWWKTLSLCCDTLDFFRIEQHTS